MTCEEFVARLSDLLDGDLSATESADSREHAGGCAHCHAVHQSSVYMIGVLRDPATLAMPEAARLRLRAHLENGLAEPLIPRESRAGAGPAPTARHGFMAWFSGWRSPGWAAAAVMVALAAGVVHWRASATTTSGWLVDAHCFAAFAAHPADHPRDCLLRCAASGYGLVDAKGKFHPFDATGNRRALAAVQASSQPDHLWVKVRAHAAADQTLDVEQLELTDPADQ